MAKSFWFKMLTGISKQRWVLDYVQNFNMAITKINHHVIHLLLLNQFEFMSFQFIS